MLEALFLLDSMLCLCGLLFSPGVHWVSIQKVYQCVAATFYTSQQDDLKIDKVRSKSIQWLNRDDVYATGPFDLSLYISHAKHIHNSQQKVSNGICLNLVRISKENRPISQGHPRFKSACKIVGKIAQPGENATN